MTTTLDVVSGSLGVSPLPGFYGLARVTRHKGQATTG